MCGDSKTRFSNRVDDYVRYRPSYPPGIVEVLCGECGLTADWAVADVGSGTGASAQLFLDHGNRVYGVEPNDAMRVAAETRFAGHAKFTSVAGSAEDTTLPGVSVDLVLAGQAFHWFDRAAAKAEFRRILKSPGWVAIVWNERRVDNTPFLRAYEELLLALTSDYRQVDHRNITGDQLRGFFHPAECHARSLDNFQRFDREGFLGRMRSSSYVPAAGEPNHDAVMKAARELFERYAEDGRVRFEYDTRLYYGRLKG